MTKLKIKIVSLGELPFQFDKAKIEKWKSNVLNIPDKIETLNLASRADLPDHEYSDNLIASSLPNSFNADILIAITSVPLELNYYTRRLSKNRVCFSFYQLADVLRPNNIPLENLVLKLLYSIALIYKRYEDYLPASGETVSFTHALTKGCLFDFNGIKSDVIYSTVKPILCDACVAQLRDEKVSRELIDEIKLELKRINKSPYFRWLDFIQARPMLSLFLSALVAIFLGIVGSVIYDKYIKVFI